MIKLFSHQDLKRRQQVDVVPLHCTVMELDLPLKTSHNQFFFFFDRQIRVCILITIKRMYGGNYTEEYGRERERE